MSDPLEASVLVLNRFYQPVRVTSARRAFCLLVRGVAQAITPSGIAHDFTSWSSLPVNGCDVVHTVSSAYAVPHVLRLIGYERINGVRLPLSHRNLMLRDEYQCQYCGVRPGPNGLNIDHVTPKSRGGRGTWDNLVTACRTCNLRKGGRTPEECGMRLLRKPRRPHSARAIDIMLGHRPRLAEWEPYLQAG